MATVGSLVVNLLGNTQNFRAEFGAVPGVLRGVTGSILSVIGAGGGLASLGRGFMLAAEAEQAATSFEVLTGSAEKANRVLGEARAYADKSPYSMAGVTESTRLLLNFGMTAENVGPTLRMLGDIAGGDEQKLHSLALAFGQSSSAGRLMGQDLNQMINAGFNPLVEISRRTGESMGALKARMEAGAISTAEVTQAFRDATSEGGRFYGMTEKQSSTVAGLWSTFRDTVDSVLRELGQTFIQTFDLKAVLSSTIGYLQGLSSWVNRNATDIAIVVTAVAAFAAALVVLRLATYAQAAAQIVLNAVQGPIGWAKLAVGAVAAAAALYGLNYVMNSNIAKMEGVAIAAKKTTDAINGMGQGAVGGSPLTQELDRLAKIREELKQTDLTPRRRQKLEQDETASLDRVNSLGGVPGAKTAATELDTLHQKLRDLKAAGGEPFELLGPGLEERIGQVSGITEKIQGLRDELSGLSKEELEAQKFSGKATNEQIGEFLALSQKTKAKKELDSARENLLKGIETPGDKFKKSLEQLHDLKKQNLISDDQFNAGKKLAAEDLAKSETKDQDKEKKPKDQPLEAIFAKSKESQNAIVRGMLVGKENPNKKLETLAEKTNANQAMANKLLEKIAQKEKEEETVVHMEYH